MNRKLTLRQLVVVVALLLTLLGALGYRFFTAPGGDPATSEPVKVFEGTTVVELMIVHRTLTNTSVAVPPPLPPPKAAPGGLVGAWVADTTTEKLTQIGKEQDAALQRALEYLRKEGVAVQMESGLPTPHAVERPLYVLIQTNETTVAADGRPNQIVQDCEVLVDRDVFLSPYDTRTVRMRLPWNSDLLSTPVTVRPETRKRKQAEAVGKALEALATVWKRENLGKKP